MKTEDSIQLAKEMLWQSHTSLDEQILPRKDSWETLLDVAFDRFCSDENKPLKDFIEELERRLIIRTLFRTNGNRKQVASILGIKYTTLHEKLKKYNIRFKNIAY
jgi:DNA-binding NtrC family response regulator